MASKSVELFISYSHRDEELRQQLDKHLASLKRQKVIEAWHDHKIEAGMEWAKQIDDNLN
ncbi:toll/interleukin-1 receptor domain-containing protein [Nostoc favosum]|uniref:Toll/interleukin-1 receptor domain-containing protein n=1 Tax=Nostoc favosum CHAB5714 TaxID=2780399 RepID=A0ABS8I1M4_9NOSO|nr:toll/interleukin-1 receptor domain-containing protein [Nostoc favosum]MCC5598104.1 toll/interleukin-1 receptor domain-containing protein [Nostoc favosum CHAB5714]